MTLRITFTSTVIALLFGSVIGLFAGYFGAGPILLFHQSWIYLQPFRHTARAGF
jgi:ABC-type dipeptide/oligopeptide/nickel transport system permease subunit